MRLVGFREYEWDHIEKTWYDKGWIYINPDKVVQVHRVKDYMPIEGAKEEDMNKYTCIDVASNIIVVQGSLDTVVRQLERKDAY
jgi:hypothetical protein